MNIVQLLEVIKTDLDALEAAIKAVDFTPQLEVIDTRIKALTGELLAKVTKPE